MLILLALISQKWVLSMSARQQMSFTRLQRSSSLREGSSSTMLLVPFQQRQTLGLQSIESMIVISSLSSVHSSNSGKVTSKGQQVCSMFPSFPNFQKYSSLFSPSSSDVRIDRQLLFASTYSIMVGKVAPPASTMVRVSREMTQKLYMPKITTWVSLIALILAQKMSYLAITLREVRRLRSSRWQTNRWVPSISRRQGPTARDSQRDGLQRQNFSWSSCESSFIVGYEGNDYTPFKINLNIDSLTPFRLNFHISLIPRQNVPNTAQSTQKQESRWMASTSRPQLQPIPQIQADRREVYFPSNPTNNFLLVRLDYVNVKTQSLLEYRLEQEKKCDMYTIYVYIEYLEWKQRDQIEERSWGEEDAFYCLAADFQLWKVGDIQQQVRWKMGSEKSLPVEYKKEELKTTHPWQQKSWTVSQKEKKYIQSSYPIEEKHYEDWRTNVAKAAGSANKDFLFLADGMGYVPNEDTKDGYVVANFPAYGINLADEIDRRKHQHAYFKEKQLYYLMYALVAAKVDAQARGETIGDIKPQNVFISCDEKIKVGCLHSFPYEKTNYAKFTDKLKPNHDVLLAPEDLKSATQNQLDNKLNKHSETFSIGATILSAGLLDDLKDIYDYPNKAFKAEVHTAKTTEWLDHQSYSEIFKSIVLSLLNPNPEKRIRLQQLWTFLLKYEKSILSKEQFIVNNPPVQFQTGVSIIRSKVK